MTTKEQQNNINKNKYLLNGIDSIRKELYDNGNDDIIFILNKEEIKSLTLDQYNSKDKELAELRTSNIELKSKLKIASDIESSTITWKNHKINQSVDDDNNKSKLSEFHSQEEDDIIKRLIPTDKFRCPDCLKRLQPQDIQKHVDLTNHGGNFRVFRDPETGKLFLRVGSGDELLDLSDTTKKEEKIIIHNKENIKKDLDLRDKITDYDYKIKDLNNRINILKLNDKLHQDKINNIINLIKTKENQIEFITEKYNRKPNIKLIEKRKLNDKRILKEIKTEVKTELTLKNINKIKQTNNTNIY